MTKEISARDWFFDVFGPEGHMHQKRCVLWEENSAYQNIKVLDLASYGTALILDDKMNTTERDEFIYHEALVDTALLAHPDPKKVFIAGGGDGAAARNALMYRTVEYVLTVDIDERVTRTIQKWIPSWTMALNDPRSEIRWEDARKFLENTNERFDVIIIDLSEPIEEGPAYLLYTKEFYETVRRKLTLNGVISIQAGTTAVGQLLCLSAVYQTVKRVFPFVAAHEACPPSFGLPWGFVIASSAVDFEKLSAHDIDRRIEIRIGRNFLRYLDGKRFVGQFLLPKHVRTALENEGRIIEDKNPLYVYQNITK